MRIMTNIRKIISFFSRNLWQLRSLPYTLYFNFHYLPFKQAIKLPILLYKPTLLRCAGSVKINANKIKYGMIRLGHNKCSIYPNTGIAFENNGGTIIFEGTCLIGRDSYISIGANATVSFGNRFECNAALKLASHYKMIFADDVSFGFDCFVVDTDFHQLSCISSSMNIKDEKIAPYGPVLIGKGCWIGAKCTLLKNTVLPAFCVVGCSSLLNKKYDIPQYTLLAGIPAVCKKVGVYRNRDDDEIKY